MKFQVFLLCIAISIVAPGYAEPALIAPMPIDVSSPDMQTLAAERSDLFRIDSGNKQIVLLKPVSLRVSGPFDMGNMPLILAGNDFGLEGSIRFSKTVICGLSLEAMRAATPVEVPQALSEAAKKWTAPKNSPAPIAGDGWDGLNGSSGRHAPAVKIAGVLTGQLTVILRGQDGQNGGDGGAAADGQPGKAGGDWQKLRYNKRDPDGYFIIKPTEGQPGGDAGIGGSPGEGGNGGHGGALTVRAQPGSDLELQYNLDHGKGGLGSDKFGKDGKPGTGGRGGKWSVGNHAPPMKSGASGLAADNPKHPRHSNYEGRAQSAVKNGMAGTERSLEKRADGNEVRATKVDFSAASPITGE